MNEVSYLAWDSDFFGLKIGSLRLGRTEPARVEALLNAARRRGYKLVYVFAQGPDPFAYGLLHQYAGKLVDTKLTYVQTVSYDQPAVSDKGIFEFDPSDDRTDLYELAYQSGEFSRFRIDNRLQVSTFTKFYKHWLDGSVTGEMADIVYTYHLPTTIGGFITVKKKIGLATIGLLATNQAVRRQGIGRALVNRAIQYTVANQLPTLEVVTQRANQIACQFYERMGFRLKETVQVYHCWL